MLGFLSIAGRRALPCVVIVLVDRARERAVSLEISVVPRQSRARAAAVLARYDGARDGPAAREKRDGA